ncbi:MAG TPA: DPP IV N-terminal domain-containing protein, partial [Bryobacteraceae bacterium]|nr:DPP IV N-terminal domain-containing protein [Bryobacteraceae bacterium]
FPRRGYRFVYPIETQCNGEPEVAAAEAVTTQAAALRRRSWVLFYVGVTLVLALAAAFLAVRHYLTTARKPDTQLRPVPLTTYVGSEYMPSFSPDGNQVAFAWTGPNRDNLDVYVKMIGTENAVRLTTGPGPEGMPAWSPDGRSIAFMKVLPENKVGIFLMPAIGGPDRKVAMINPCSEGLSWHASGEWLAVTEQNPLGAPCSIYAVSITTGEKRKLTNPQAPSADSFAEFSPDGSRLVFFRSRVAGDLYIVTVSDQMVPAGEPRRLTSLNLFRSTANWTPDGKEVIFSSFQEGEPDELWRMPASGESAPRRVAIQGEGGAFPVISREGNRLAYVHFTWNTDILRLPINGRKGEGSEPTPFAASTRSDLAPQYSPDGKRVAFISVRSGTNEVWVCDADGSNPVQVTTMAATMTGAPRWAPDGQQLVFDSTKQGSFDIYTVRADGGAPKRLTDDPADDGVASWSRDGRWIYFASDRSKDWQIWKMPAAGGKAVQVTQKGGRLAFESADGRDLYYSKDFLGTSIWRMPAGGGEEVQVLESALGFSFVPAAQGLYFVAHDHAAQGSSIRRLDLATGHIATLFHPQRLIDLGLAVSPDERFLLYAQRQDTDTDLMLVEGFR